MKRDQIRCIGLFFLLGLMDEAVALNAAQRALAKLKARFPETSDSTGTAFPSVALVEVCLSVWNTAHKHASATDADFSVCSLPPEINLDVWRRFQRDASEDEIMTILFSTVLGISDADLAAGMKTTVGTIRYRLGKGIRQLGLVARSPGRAPTAGARP